MRRVLTALLIAAVVTGIAGAADANRVLAIEWAAGGGQLRWVSETTLKPTDAVSLNVGGAPASVSAISPDGSLVALGGGDGGRLRVVDLSSLEEVALVRLGGGFVSRGVSQTADRLHVMRLGDPTEVVTVDPLTERIVQRRKLVGTAISTLAAGKRLVVLLAPMVGIGHPRLAVVAADGSVRTVALRGATAGVVWTRRSEARSPFSRIASPGFAVSRDGDRAVVVGPRKLVEIDLGTLDQRTVVLSKRALARVAKAPLAGWDRRAIWLAEGTLAVVGQSYSSKDGRTVSTKTGLRLLDLRSGASRTLDETAIRATLVGDILLASGGSALRGYTAGGTLKFEVLVGENTGYVQTAGGHAYVGRGNSTRFTIVDVGGGRVVGEARTHKPLVVLGP